MTASPVPKPYLPSNSTNFLEISRRFDGLYLHNPREGRTDATLTPPIRPRITRKMRKATKKVTLTDPALEFVLDDSQPPAPEEPRPKAPTRTRRPNPPRGSGCTVPAMLIGGRRSPTRARRPSRWTNRMTHRARKKLFREKNKQAQILEAIRLASRNEDKLYSRNLREPCRTIRSEGPTTNSEDVLLRCGSAFSESLRS